MLQQHSSPNISTPASSQFTFTCDSQVPGMQWPGKLRISEEKRHSCANPLEGQSSRTGAANDGAPSAQGEAGELGLSPKPTNGNNGGPVTPRKQSRRELERELKLAARHRRRLTAQTNFHNPPKPDDVWICEFCEYERIFGVPPRVLTRDYEIKARRLRQEEADRKRLLEKAKAKSRKSKKAGKAPAKGGQVTNNPSGQPTAEPEEDQGALPMHAGHSHSTQCADYGHDFEDGQWSDPSGVMYDDSRGD